MYRIRKGSSMGWSHALSASGEKSAERGAVLITGASSGIGRACALRLDADGFQVFAGVRKKEDGVAVQQQASVRLTPLLLDVTREQDIASAVAIVSARMNAAGLAGVINNAGVVCSGPLEFISSDALRKQLEVNLIGPLAIIRAFLPLLRKHQGRIVNVGSTSGKIASSFLGPYCASKFALEAVTDALRMELRPPSVQVSIIEPGPLATAIWQKQLAAEDALMSELPPEGRRLYGEALAQRRRAAVRMQHMPADLDQVCDAIVHALTASRPKTRYPVGLGARAKTLIARLAPDRVRDWLIEFRRR